jgi:hypothetical protein
MISNAFYIAKNNGDIKKRSNYQSHQIIAADLSYQPVLVPFIIPYYGRDAPHICIISF